MKAMVLNHLVDLSENQNPLEFKDMPKPEPREHEILIKVLASGVCHTELDEIEGRTPPPSFPIIPGHQVIGEVKESGSFQRAPFNRASGPDYFKAAVFYTVNSAAVCRQGCNGMGIFQHGHTIVFSAVDRSRR